MKLNPFVATQMSKLPPILLILAVIAVVSFYRIGMLEWGATLINRDNSLSTQVTRSNLPYFLGGLLLGIGLCYYRRKRSAMPAAGLRALFAFIAMAVVSLALSLSWDVSLLHSINETLVRDFPERLAYESPSLLYMLLSGILLFSLSSLFAGFIWKCFCAQDKAL